jgi:hypothetical protein
MKMRLSFTSLQFLTILPTARVWTAFSCLFCAAMGLDAMELPPIPVGLDAYRLWESWPTQRIGVRAYMRSTYDRSGGNEMADASHFLYQLDEERNVTLDVAGSGVLYFARYNRWHGSPWHYEVDGRNHTVWETSTADPNHPDENSMFLPRRMFPSPLTWTWVTTRGADLMWVPIPFEHSFRMAYSRTKYGTGYYIYHIIDPTARLSQPIRAWDGRTPPDNDVLELIGRAGTDLVPAANSIDGRRRRMRGHRGSIDLDAGSTALVAALEDGPRMVRALEFSIPRTAAIAFGRTRLRVTWDGLPHASIDAPIALFFGAGTLYNRDEREYLVKAFPVHVRFDTERVHLACFLPMPFGREARIELTNAPSEIRDVRWDLRSAPLSLPMHQMGYLHATYRDYPEPIPGEDLVLLDTRQVEGGGDWSGSFIGTSFIFSHRGVLTTLEGDPRFFFDDSQTPQAQGTGTEEWAGGGDYWGGRNMTLPFAGHPCGARKPEEAKDPEDLIQSAYRFLLADLMPFGRNAVIRLEHGGENQSTEHYETVAFWYGRSGATLVKTDTLQLGDSVSEREHDYHSPTASAAYEIESRYEWGIDRTGSREIYFPHRDRGRKITGESEFSIDVSPVNLGVLLRRKLDYQFPNQRAEIFVAAFRGGVLGEYRHAGVWYLAGSNTCLFSFPRGELDPTQHVVQVSNRRFRDDEFLISRRLTAGAAKLRVRVVFNPVEIPLMPGRPLPELGWSEIRYDAYSYVLQR